MVKATRAKTQKTPAQRTQMIKVEFELPKELYEKLRLSVDADVKAKGSTDQRIEALLTEACQNAVNRVFKPNQEDYDEKVMKAVVEQFKKNRGDTLFKLNPFTIATAIDSSGTTVAKAFARLGLIPHINNAQSLDQYLVSLGEIEVASED